MIVANVLTTICKWEVAAMHEQVCVATVALPRVLVIVEAERESDEASQAATREGIQSLGCSFRCKTRGLWPPGRRTMPTTPRRRRRGQWPSNGTPPECRRASP